MLDINELYKKYDGEAFMSDRVSPRPSSRDDLCAFILLDYLAPGSRGIVCTAEHDEVRLDVDMETLRKKATEENIITLIRLGVLYDETNDGFYMFV